MASPDHKRRWAETNPGATAIPSRPPLKKRFTSNISISVASSSSSSASAPPSSATSPTTANGSSSLGGGLHSSSPSTDVQNFHPLITHSVVSSFAKDSEKIPVKALSKDAWLKRMKDAKVECSNLQTNQLALESDCVNLEACKGIIRVQLNMIQQDLLLVAKSKRIADVTTQYDDISQETGAAERKWLTKMHSMARKLQVAILDHVKMWTDSAYGLEKQWQQGLDTSQKHTLLSEWLLREMEDLRAAYQQEQACLYNIKQDHALLSQQSEEIIKQIQLTTEEMERNKVGLDDCTTALMQIEKRQERLKSKVISVLASGGLEELTADILDAPTTPTSGMASPVAIATPSAPTTSPSLSAVTARGYSDTDIEPGSIADQTMKSQLSEHQLIVDARSKELSALKLERQSLLADMDRLRLQFARIPDEQLVNTDYYKNLQTSYEYYRHRAHHLDQMRTSLDRTLDDLVRARKRWMDDLKSEKAAQSTTMESELKRLENDLIRIRGQRDQFQSQYDDQVARELELKDANQLAIDFAEKEKQYINSLESRLHELKSDTTVAGPLAQDLTSFNELRLLLMQSKYSLERLQEIDRKWNTDESQQSVVGMKKRINFLRTQLEQWKSYGNNAKSDIHECIKPLMTEMAGYSAESQKLSLMVNIFEKTESQLLDEIDKMASIYGRLEEQRSKDVFEDEYKPEYRSKLMAEKSKFAQTFPTLVTARDKQLANVATLRHTSDKQKDLIAQLKEHEKSLELQLSGKENDNGRMVQSVEDDKSMVEALTQQLEEASITLDSLDAHVLELQKVLKEKTRTLEEEKQVQTQVEGDHDKMKRKWDMISHGDNPQEQQLAEECDELRSLLKCGTCRTRFRSHLITRCMHTFCKKCIDARLETRQRRCPTCGESFGANDVRQFYL